MLEPALVNPLVTAATPRLGTVALLVATPGDCRHLHTLLPLAQGRSYSLLLSRLHYDLPQHPGLAVCGPVVGAPYAVMLLESLVAWGVRQVIFLGWCGSLTARAPVGSLILPDGAVVDEGVSRHYHAADLPRDAVIRPAPPVRQALQQTLKEHRISCLSGLIWTTDAIYRETPSRVRHYQRLGVLAVEMELSALFSVAAFRNIALGAVLVVSDDLFSGCWRPGFKQPAFISARAAAAEAVVRCAGLLQGNLNNGPA